MRKNQQLKTVGPQTAHLIAALYDRAQTTFTNSDVTAISGLEANSARSLVRKAEARGLVTRLKPGLFVLVPPELGNQCFKEPRATPGGRSNEADRRRIPRSGLVQR